MQSTFEISVIIGYVNSLPNCGQPGGNGSGSGNGIPTILASSYPNARRDEKVHDVYAMCTDVKDPYRWLEDPCSEETKKFIEAENAITRPFLDKSPSRAEINTRLKELFNYAKYKGPFQHGKKYFSYQNTGLQNQDVVIMQDSLECEGKVFFDPNTLSDDGTTALDITTAGFSDDGLIFAYGLSASGSDWITIQFKHVEKGDIYKDKLYKVKFADVWWNHNKGIFYGAMLDKKGKSDGSENDATTNQKIYYHVLGTEQCDDIVVVEFPDQPEAIIATFMSSCGRYFIAGPTGGTSKNLVYVADLEKINYEIKTKFDLIPVVTQMEADFIYVTNNDRIFIFLTNKDADNYRLVAINIDNPDPKCWTDFVPQNEKYVLQWAKPAYNYLVLCYNVDVKSVLQLHDIKTGKLVKKFDLELGKVDETDKAFSGDRKYKDMYFRLESFLTPGVIYHCDLSKPTFDLQVLKELKVNKLDREKFIVEQVFANSKDGTKIPIHIFYKKGLQKNSNNPAFLYGYGGYGDVTHTLPSFKPERIFFADNFNGIVAIASIRGGGEYGEHWHRAGSLDKKQNCFTDFQSAAEFLIAEKYTTNKLLTINGRSNGGLLMGACLNQRPDLFGAVVADVGIMDMLRFQKFTIGHAWVVEFGSSDNEKDFPYLFKYSPLHNVKIATNQYPATLLTTSEHDDRVPPLHSLKFIATLQYEAKNHPNQINPFLISIETNGGHGKFKSLTQLIKKATDMMCFIANVIGVKFIGSNSS